MNLRKLIENCYEGDFVRKYSKLKEDINGRLYVRYEVKPNASNYEYLMAHSERYSFCFEDVVVPDRRTKEGYRVKFTARIVDGENDGEKMSLSEFLESVKTVEIDESVYIESMIDVIPYLANRVVSDEREGDFRRIIVSAKREFDEFDDRRHEDGSWESVKPGLDSHWEFVRSLIATHLNDEGRRKVKTLSVIEKDGVRYVEIGEPIDCEWPVEAIDDGRRCDDGRYYADELIVLDANAGKASVVGTRYEKDDEVRITYVARR